MIITKDPLYGLLQLAPSPAFRGLTPKQLKATRGIARFRAWLAGRRSGKSYAAAVQLLGGKRGETSIYIARTLKSAKAIILNVFVELNDKYKLGLHIRAATGTITEPSGHVIQLFGIKDRGAADLIRGIPKLRKVFLDEAGAFTDELLKYSIENVLQPMLLDLQGHMSVAGTPGVIPKGYWYDITGNPGMYPPIAGRWQTHHWTYEDNPHVNAELVIQEALEANGITPQDATFMREFLAIWCEDLDAIIYRYKGENPDNGGWAPMPKSGMTVMCIDFGVVDQTAWAVGRQEYESRPHLHVLKAYGESNLDLPEIAKITQQLRERFDVYKIYADEGALGKGYANNLRNQYKLPIEPMDKQHKRSKIDVVRGRIAAGTLHLCAEAETLYDEWRTLCWNMMRDDHHPRQADDLSDVVCYLCHAPEFDSMLYEAPKIITQETNEQIRQAAMRKASRGKGLGRF